MSTGFLKSVACKACGQPMTPENGWRFSWTEENEIGNAIADHYFRSWSCPCGTYAEEHGVDDPPSDFAENLLGTGELDWHGATDDVCPHCGSDWTERVDVISKNPVVWSCGCWSCEKAFTLTVQPVEGGE